MINKGISLIIVIALVVTCSMTAFAYNENGYVARFRFEDTTNMLIHNVDVVAYVYDIDGNATQLQNIIQTKDGIFELVVSNSILNKYIHNDLLHFNIKAFADGKQMVSKHWSVNPNEVTTSKATNNTELIVMKSVLRNKTIKMRSGTGVFRVRKAYSTHTNKNVIIGEMHVMPDSKGFCEYENSKKIKITTAIKSGYSWAPNVNSSVAIKGSMGGTLQSGSTENSFYIEAPHSFAHEYWVREELHDDVYEKWVEVDKWEEMVPLSYNGGLLKGSSVDSSTNQDGISDPSNSLYNISTLTKGNSWNKSLMGTYINEAGWEIDGVGIKIQASYNSNFKLTYSTDHATKSFWLYAPENNLLIWYISLKSE